jgi:3-oxoadipate enol-lactonase
VNTFELSPGNTLTYEHTSPSSGDGCTYVFFNALTGSAEMWRGDVAQALHDAGHGTLLYNMRGQADTTFSPGTHLDMNLVVADAVALLGALQPVRPVYVGLSIGGLFAAWVHLGGAPCVGLVLVNTLRRDGPRLQWINAAVTRAAEIGGQPLVMDLFAPLLFDETWLAANRAGALDASAYAPMDQHGGVYGLLSNGGGANWDVPWESLAMPTLVLTGRQDHVFYDETDVAVLSARLPAARRVTLDDAGHMIPVERPEAFIAELLALGVSV